MMNEQFWTDYENETRNILHEELKRKATFFRDGIVSATQNDFNNKSFRPLFIMKEVHNENGCNECDKKEQCALDHIYVEHLNGMYVDFVKCKDIQECVKTWHKIAVLTKILYQFSIGCPPIQSELDKKEASDFIQKAAIINLKKIQGGKTDCSDESMDTLHYTCHTTKFHENIKNQIKDINPSVIICCGTMNSVLQNKLCDVNKEPILDFADVNLRGLSKAYLGTVNINPVIIIDMWHPSTSISYKAFSEAMRCLIEKGFKW